MENVNEIEQSAGSHVVSTILQPNSFPASGHNCTIQMVTVNEQFRTTNRKSLQLAHTNMIKEHRFKIIGVGRKGRLPYSVTECIGICKLW